MLAALKLNTKHWVALGLVVALVIWFLTGSIRGAQTEAPAASNGAEQESGVRARWSEAQPFQAELPLQGELQPWQQVMVRARINGQVESLTLPQGNDVEHGTVLMQLDAEDRRARVTQLEAEIAVAEAELAAAQRLQQSDLIAQTERLRLAAALARVQAELEAAQLQLSYTRIAAPFSGWYDRRLVDEGDFVQAGQELLVLADIKRLRVRAYIPQQRIDEVQIGQNVVVELLNGIQLDGKVHHLSRVATAETRSFLIEVEVDNPQQRPVAGASANLRISLSEVEAHRLSPSALRLDGNGFTIVRTLNEADEVTERRVDILSMTRDAVYVSGLANRERVIIRGAGFTTPGEQVNVEMEVQ